MDKCCFQVFESLRGRYPPCSEVRWNCVGIGGALYVFLSVLDILLMSVSSEEHAFDHCATDKLSLVVKVEVKEFIKFVFSSKNSVVKWCAFSLGMGLRIQMLSLVVGGGVLLRSVLCGIFSWIGEWSELRRRFVFVVDVNWAWFGWRM